MNTIRKLLYLLILPVISGILLGISVPGSGVWFISFLAFIPLLFAAQKVLSFKKHFSTFCIQLLLTLVVFYFIAGFWILQTANLGFIIAILVVVPYFVTVLPYIIILKKNKSLALLYFLVSWVTAEFIQSYIPIGSPFYNLGHNPGVAPALIQWYEYTGSAGGTIWILAVNVSLFNLISSVSLREQGVVNKVFYFLAVLLLPMVISLVIFNTYDERGKKVKVMIVHPATDCFNMKYNTDIYQLMDYYLDIVMPELDDEIKYVVLPETAVTNGGWLHELERNLVLDHFNLQTLKYPDLCLVTGAVTYKEINGSEKIKEYDKQPQVKYSNIYNKWYYTYNTALQVEKYKPVQFRTKQKLVPFQEYTPLPGILPNVLPLGVDFQFSSGNDKKNIFTSSENKIAAIICYEAAYGKLYRKFSKEGAGAFFELLNEGWYVNTKVSGQFLNLSVIRAIENRRYIARSSNMGISCFINQKGKVTIKNEEKVKGSIVNEMVFNKKRTLYSMLGEYLSIISIITMFFCFMLFFKIKLD